MSDDLESFWDEIRDKSPIQVVSDRVSDLESQLILASEKAVFDLTAKFKTFDGEPVTKALLQSMVAFGVRRFMFHWKEGLRKQDLAGLIEIVLEAQQLTPEEMLTFVQALPGSLLERISKSGFSGASGTHALMAVEWHRRQGLASGLTLARVGDRVQATFLAKNGEYIQFFLDEPFELDSGDAESV